MSNHLAESQAVLGLEALLGLPTGFLARLLDENDWSFVIKVHAFLEAATTHLRVGALGQRSLLGTLARLELSNKTTGKIAFIKSLSLLDDDARRYISTLSELRNDLVHDVRQVTFTFAEYVSSQSESQRKAFVKAFLYPVHGVATGGSPAEEASLRQTLTEALLRSPKYFIWAGAVVIANLVYAQQPDVQIQRLLASLGTPASPSSPGV